MEKDGCPFSGQYRGHQVRSTLDLIHELRQEQESGRFVVVALAVGFENSTSFVSAKDPNPLEKLNAFVEQGGEPIGFLALTRSGREGTVETRLLDEYLGQEWAAQYLTALAANFGAEFEASGFGRASGKKH